YGECLCGVVKYKYTGETGQVINCHCSECRKWHGAAYRTRTVGSKSKFVWVSGEDNVGRYEGQPNAIKTFCKECGSNLISLYKDNEDLIGLPLGGIEGARSLKPTCHVFVDYKADWHSIEDDLPQHKELPGDLSSIHTLTDKS
ncbi:MAG: GFA family protein, partial [Gammaproteobacteria bacterium]|nr:GFA family protein [Gammaproteobacteria bacterium]